jgi:capsular exopolysaccharide synthesis family protein
METDNPMRALEQRHPRDAWLVAPPSPGGDRLFTWEQAVRVLRKNRNFAIVVTGLLSLAAVVVAATMKDVYQPVARLEVEPVSSGIRTLHEIDEFDSAANPEYLETQSQILQSDALAVSVIRALNLVENPEFVSKKDRARWKDPSKHAEAVPSASRDHFLQDQLVLANRTTLESLALQVFHKGLSINPIRSSRLIEVSFTAHDPEVARQVTNALVAHYIDQSYRTRYATTMEVSEWLSKQLNDLREKVKESNQEVTDYQRKYGLVETDDHDVPLAQLMSEVNRQLSDAQANRIELEAHVRLIDLGQTDALPAFRDDQVYQDLMKSNVEVRAKLAEARAIYGDNNSNVRKLESQSNEISEQLDKERKDLVSRLRASYAASASREAMMKESREKVKKEMGDAGSHMVAYRLLKNEAIANAQLYNTLQGRLNEAGIYAGLKSGNIRVVDLAAKLPKPSGPNRQVIVGAGIALSVMIGLLLAFVRESFDNKVRTPDDIRSRTGLASLAMVPSFGAETGKALRRGLDAELLSNGKSSFENRPKVYLRDSAGPGAEAIRDLRTALMFSRAGGPPRTFLLTSPSPGEGKTTVAMNLAAALSQRSKTCLLECDLRSPQISQAFGLLGNLGLSHVLIGAIPEEKALVRIPELPGLSVMAAGASVPNPGDLIASDQMRHVCNTLKNEFDYVVLDAPPVIPFSDARFLASVVESVILVARYEFTTQRAIERGAQLLQEVQAPLVGFVLNDIDLDSPDYHYFNYGYSNSVKGYLRYSRKAQTEITFSETSPESPKHRIASA